MNIIEITDWYTRLKSLPVKIVVDTEMDIGFRNLVQTQMLY